MKKLLMASTAAVCFGTGAFAAGHEVNVGVILGFTGPIESITPAMAASAELAISEVNAAGGAAGKTLVPVRADSTCIDAAAASTAARTMHSRYTGSRSYANMRGCRPTV